MSFWRSLNPSRQKLIVHLPSLFQTKTQVLQTICLILTCHQFIFVAGFLFHVFYYLFCKFYIFIFLQNLKATISSITIIRYALLYSIYRNMNVSKYMSKYTCLNIYIYIYMSKIYMPKYICLNIHVVKFSDFIDESVDQKLLRR